MAGVRAAFDGREVTLLAGLPEQMEELLTLGDGAVHERLFPRAYLDPTEDEAEREWQRLMHKELLDGKLANLSTFRTTLERGREGRGGSITVELTAEEADAWLGVLNDLRLALGSMLDVTEDIAWDDLDPHDPRTGGLHLYGFLSWVQDELIQALST